MNLDGALNIDVSTDPSKPEFGMHLKFMELGGAYLKFTQMTDD
jgi:hypothetical protein